LPPHEPLPEAEPEFFFTAHSAWCPFKQSSNVTVELKRPEVTEVKAEAVTYDNEGNETGSEATGKIEYGKQAIIKAQTKEVENGKYVNFIISCDSIGFSTTKAAEVKDGIAELRFNPSIDAKALAALKDGDELVYKCAVETADKRAKNDDCNMKVVFTYVVEYVPGGDIKKYDDEYTLESTDGAYKQTHDVLDDSIPGDNLVTLVFTDVLPGKNYSLVYHNRKTDKSYSRFSDVPFSRLAFQIYEG
jgi:hypothetical protein